MKPRLLILLIALSIIRPASLFAGSLDNVNIHGFISQGFLQTSEYNYFGDTEDGTFEFNEMGINFGAKPSEKLRIGIQLFARDLGDFGNDELKIDWAFADYRLNNLVGIRVGKFKTIHGLYNEIRDIDSLRTYIFLPGSIYLESFRDLLVSMKGGCIYGEIPGGLSYQASYGVVPMSIDDPLLRYLTNMILPSMQYLTAEQARSIIRSGALGATGAPGIPQAHVDAYLAAGGFPGAPQQVVDGIAAAYAQSAADQVTVTPTHVQDKNNLNAALQWWTPVDGLKLAASYLRGEIDFTFQVSALDQTFSMVNNYDEMSVNVLSAEYIWGDTVFAGEYIFARFKSTTSLSNALGPPSDYVMKSEGWYYGLSHRFTGWLELGGYHSEYYLDKDSKSGSIYLPKPFAFERDNCLSARFDLNPYWLFKLEGHLIDGAANTVGNVSEPSDAFDEFFLFAAKVSYSF